VENTSYVALVQVSGKWVSLGDIGMLFSKSYQLQDRQLQVMQRLDGMLDMPTIMAQKHQYLTST